MLCVLKKTNFSYFYRETGYFFAGVRFLNKFSISVFILGKSRYSGYVAVKGAHVSGLFIKKTKKKKQKMIFMCLYRWSHCSLLFRRKSIIFVLVTNNVYDFMVTQIVQYLCNPSNFGNFGIFFDCCF